MYSFISQYAPKFSLLAKCSWRIPYWMIICNICASTLSIIWSVDTFFSLFHGFAKGENKAWVLLRFLNHISPGICSTKNRNVVANKLQTDMEKWHTFLLYNFTRHGTNSYQRFWHDLLSYLILGKYNKNSFLPLEIKRQHEYEDFLYICFSNWD